MKLILFLTWREIRFRRKQLLPFVLIAMALIFTSVSLITFQESANVGEPINYMTSPTYMILFSALALIGFSASRSYFSLLGETVLAEMGTLRALGMKRHMVRRFWLLLGGVCIGVASVFAVPLALVYIRLFVKMCTSMDMSMTSFVPLVYRIPIGNILLVLLLLAGSMIAGILVGRTREKSIVALIRSVKIPVEAENDNGDLPEEGDLSSYGRLYIRRSVKRCVKYNVVIAFLLILPTIFLLGAFTFEVDRSTHTYTLWQLYDNTVTAEMIEEIERLPGVEKAEGALPMKAGFGNTAIGIRIYAEEGTDLAELCNRVVEFGETQLLKFDDTAVKREINNMLERSYRNLFLTNAAILFAVGCLTSFGLLKARLTVRKRELSLLYALGAREEDIMKAVTPETVADYALGALLSVALGAIGFVGIMADGGGSYRVLPILLLCPLFLAGSVLTQVGASKRMTARIIARTDIRE